MLLMWRCLPIAYVVVYTVLLVWLSSDRVRDRVLYLVNGLACLYLIGNMPSVGYAGGIIALFLSIVILIGSRKFELSTIIEVLIAPVMCVVALVMIVAGVVRRDGQL